jgi:hypothetical protein
MLVVLQKRLPLMLIYFERTFKKQLESGQESMGDTPVLSLGSLLRSPLPKPIIVLEHFRE